MKLKTKQTMKKNWQIWKSAAEHGFSKEVAAVVPLEGAIQIQLLMKTRP